ncbi:MAG TPA: methyltransferase domain-containing protein [Acidimicrobiales bacterium]
MSDQRTTQTTATDERYAGNPAEIYERHFVPTIGLPFARRLLATAGLGEGESVLDVACGTGVAARLAAEAVGPTGSVTGVDVNPGMLAVARAATPAGTTVAWYGAPAEDLPLPDASVDAVLCSLGFQFFTDKVGALREMRRVLAPGGRAVLVTPGPTPPLFQVLDGVLSDHLGPGASVFVTTVFSVHDPAEVRDLLRTAGFGDVDVESTTLRLRLPPPADFLWQYVLGTPLSAMAAHLDGEARAALEREVVARWRPFTDGGSLGLDVGSLVATARPDHRPGR